MSDRLQRLRRLAPVALVLAGLLAAASAQAQSWYRPYRNGGDHSPPRRGQQDRPPPRQFAEPDRAAKAAREATRGSRVLGVKGADSNGSYRVRILEPGGRVRSLQFDPSSGKIRD